MMMMAPGSESLPGIPTDMMYLPISRTRNDVMLFKEIICLINIYIIFKKCKLL